MSQPYLIRILAVDYHKLTRTGIAMLLLPEPDLELVGEASNGRGMRRRVPEMTTPVGAANQKPRRRFRFGRLLRKAQESAKEGR